MMQRERGCDHGTNRPAAEELSDRLHARLVPFDEHHLAGAPIASASAEWSVVVFKAIETTTPPPDRRVREERRT
jgi:hypothetical protein